jgi:hypothetical protein
MSASDAPAMPGLPPGLFEFSGQSCIDAWTITEALDQIGWSRYEYVLSHRFELCFQRIRDLVDAFPTWQHRNTFGRPQFDDRVILTSLLVRQFMRATFREAESFLRLTRGFFGFDRVPDASTLSLKNRSGRFLRLFERFFDFVLDQLPTRRAIIATDATGFGNDKRTWRDTPFPYRTKGRRYVKANCAVEIPTMLVRGTTITAGKLFESKTFEKTWDKLPGNVLPYRSLADSAYSGQPCVEAAVRHGATPFHDIPSNARLVRWPKTEREKMIHFAKHWPNRVKAIRGRRALVESTFSKVKELFGDRLRCRSWVGRQSEALAKYTAYNLHVINTREFISGRPSRVSV